MHVLPARSSGTVVALVGALLLALLVGGWPAPAAAHGTAETTTGMRGLRATEDGPCAGGYRITGTDFCTHGPDEAPAGRRPALLRRSIAATLDDPLPGAILCDGDGRSGKRVQAIHARVAGSPSRRDTVLPRIRAAAVEVQSAFLASAARTDGIRRPRWVTSDGCQLSIAEVTLSEKARTSFSATILELQDKGFDRADRKYLVWWDTSVYCGIATFRGDDRRGAANASEALSGYARVDEPCWGFGEAHELMHTLGAVQDTAPHTTFGVAPGAFAHCTDDYDVMCYSDAPGVVLTVACDDRALDTLFDCGNDDYFHTRPPSGSYLATHWNTADSGWLVRSVATPVRPLPSLVAGATVGPQRVPVTVPLTTRDPLAELEVVRAQRRGPDGRWTSVGEVSGTTLMPALKPGRSATWRVRTAAADGSRTLWITGPGTTARITDDRAGTLRWGRGWTRAAASDAIAGTLHVSRRAGARVTLTTDAAEIGIVAATGPLAGRLVIRVDGRVRRTLDLRSETATSRTLVAAVALGEGRHSVELRVKAPRTETPGWRVGVDAVVRLDR
jgi:hypothetical protein